MDCTLTFFLTFSFCVLLIALGCLFLFTLGKLNDKYGRHASFMAGLKDLKEANEAFKKRQQER